MFGTVVVHDRLLRGMIPPPQAGGWHIRVWHDRPDLDASLDDLERSLGPGHVLIHTTIPVARRLQRSPHRWPRLAGGVSLPGDALHAHAQHGRLGDMMANAHALYAPFGALLSLEPTFDAVFGPDRFLRPDSPFKPFSGRPIPAGQWADEIAAIAAVDRPDPALLCLVAPLQRLAQPEWRFWCVDGAPVASAPYSFDTPLPHDARPPAALAQIAEAAAQRLVDIDMLMVVDATFDGKGNPKIVEANAFSTSGFTPGVDWEALWEGAAQAFA